ncbi:MAG TPA: hypothetical protein PKM63_03900 [Panacibacter sp.]|nr:hypothetical protein [Panacibacter sp.]HNP43401.1 hypothetical protein [Panacibacter sp.]
MNQNQPSEIRVLENLTKIKAADLSDNKLTEIPDFLLRLGHPISWVQEWKGNIILVADNPFTNPPPEIIKQGNEAIQECHENSLPGNQKIRTAQINAKRVMLIIR